MQQAWRSLLCRLHVIAGEARALPGRSGAGHSRRCAGRRCAPCVDGNPGRRGGLGGGAWTAAGLRRVSRDISPTPSLMIRAVRKPSRFTPVSAACAGSKDRKKPMNLPVSETAAGVRIRRRNAVLLVALLALVTASLTLGMWHALSEVNASQPAEAVR